MTHPVLPIDDRSDVDKFLDGFATAVFDLDVIEVDGEFFMLPELFGLSEKSAIASMVRDACANQKLQEHVFEFMSHCAVLADVDKRDWVQLGYAYGMSGWTDSNMFYGLDGVSAPVSRTLCVLAVERDWFDRYEVWLDDVSGNGDVLPRFDFY